VRAKRQGPGAVRMATGRLLGWKGLLVFGEMGQLARKGVGSVTRHQELEALRCLPQRGKVVLLWKNHDNVKGKNARESF